MASDSGTYTEDTYRRRTEIAQKLLEQARGNPSRNWAEGLGNLSETALGGYQQAKADAQKKVDEYQSRKELATVFGLPAPPPPDLGSSGAAKIAGALGFDWPSQDKAAAPQQTGFQKIASLFGGGAGDAPAPAAAAPMVPPAPAPPPVIPPQAAAPSISTLASPPVAPPVAAAAPPPPPRVPVEPLGDVVRTNPDGTIAGNITAPSIPAPPSTPAAPSAVGVSPPPTGAPPTIAASPSASSTPPPTLLGNTSPQRKAQIGALLISKNPELKAMGHALMTQAMAESDTPKYDFKTAGDSLYRTNAKTGTADPIRDVGRTVKPMTDDERKQWKVPEGVAAGIDDNGKPVFSQPSNVNTVSPVIAGINDRFDTQMKAAQAAPQVVSSIHEARRALDSGAITGAGADSRLMLDKVGTLFGIPSERVANTEVARAALGAQVLESAKTLGANPSNADRDYIEKVKGGSIDLDEGSMRRLLDMQEKWARDSVKRANDTGKKMVETDPEKLGRFAPMLRVDEPPAYEDYIKNNPAKAATAPAAPGQVRKFNPATGKIE